MTTRTPKTEESPTTTPPPPPTLPGQPKMQQSLVCCSVVGSAYTAGEGERGGGGLCGITIWSRL
eukprot:1602889-Rhodomonas_salina.2